MLTHLFTTVEEQMDKSIKLKCGCEIPVVDGKIHINYDNLNYECQKVWKLYSEGYTRSIFQLESRLCQTWAKELKPKSITEAADLISVVRPGTLNSQDENGTSMTKVFANRKNELVEYDKDSPVAKMLRNTYSILCYQEQILKIAKDIAGFSPKDSNKLLKAIGKKQSAILIELEPLFIKGCEEKGIISKQEAIDLFNNIKNAGRYSFNFSHAVSYSVIGYQTAWVKAHLPHQYICSWLKISKSEQKPLEEIRAMMSEARRLKIKVYGPSARNLPKTDFFINDDCVYFGLSAIKDCSEKSFDKIITAVPAAEFKKMNWTDFLINYSPLLSKSQIIPMCQTGCFDDFSLKARLECEFEFNQFNTLTLPQKKACRAYYDPKVDKDLVDVMIKYSVANPKLEKVKLAIYSLQNPPMDLSDSKKNMIEHEKELLGINITCSHIERATIPNTALTCKAINAAPFEKYKVFMVVGEISEFQEFKIKNGKMVGQMMANLKLTDSTDELDVVVFPNALDQFQSALYESNVVMIKGKKSNRGGLILEEIYEV